MQKKSLKDLSEIHHSRTLSLRRRHYSVESHQYQTEFPQRPGCRQLCGIFKDSKCISFDEMGFHKMLFSSEDQKILRDYTRLVWNLSSAMTGSIIPELVKTLAVYLKSGRSIQQVCCGALLPQKYDKLQNGPDRRTPTILRC